MQQNLALQVYKETGARYILGLNFEDVNLKLTQAQIKRAKANLPEDSVVTFELGNEVSEHWQPASKDMHVMGPPC